jgi:hypothetical protein
MTLAISGGAAHAGAATEAQSASANKGILRSIAFQPSAFFVLVA